MPEDEGRTFTLSLELEAVDHIDLDTYAATTVDLRKLLMSLTAEAAGGREAHWLLKGDPIISVAASVNGVSADALESVVGDAYDAIAAMTTDSPDAWPTTISSANRKLTRTMVNRLRRQAPVLVEATDKEPLVLPSTGVKGGESRRVFASWGSVDGGLDAISVHGQLRFTLFELGTDYPVRCTLPQHFLSRVISLLGEPVRVHGFIYYRANGHPSSITGVTELEQLRSADRRLSDLFGAAPNITRGVPSGEYVRRLRAGGDE